MGVEGLVADLLGNELFVIVLAGILAVVIDVANGVGPRRAIAYESARGILFRVVDPMMRPLGLGATREKVASDRIASLYRDTGLVTLAKHLWAEGFRWNPTSTKKYRTEDDKKVWSLLSVARREDDGTQTHLYIIREMGRLVVRGHHEASAANPVEHLTTPQTQAPRTEAVEAALEGLVFEWGPNT